MTKNNIILITLDSVRADHLGCYGYPDAKTPAIDRLAQKGALFEQAFCQTPNTWVSHASILSGCYPNRHGLRSHLDGLSSKVPDLPSLLRENGYATAGFPAHELVGSLRGFDRGFDCFDEVDFLHASTMAENLKQGRKWQPTIEKAFKWIPAQNQPFFLWLHYMGTHWEPPESLSTPIDFLNQFSPVGQYYDGKIAFADQVCIGAITQFLQEQNLTDSTILVITADHGEEDLLKNDPPYRNQAHNNTISDAVMHVPLIMAGAGIPKGRRIKSLVRLIDIAPMLLELSGIDPEPIAFDGKSLVHYFTQPGDELPVTWAYMENLPRRYTGVRTDEYKLVFRVGPPPAPRDLISKIKRKANRYLKYFKTDAGEAKVRQTDRGSYADWKILSTVGLYHILTDPEESMDVSSDPSLQPMLSLLREFVQGMMHQSVNGPTTLSTRNEEIIVQRLQDLGYLD